jgi:hypothetical protein
MQNASRTSQQQKGADLNAKVAVSDPEIGLKRVKGASERSVESVEGSVRQWK